MSNKLLDKLGLTSLITKVADTFAKKVDLVDYAKKSDLDNKQDKLTRVIYFDKANDPNKVLKTGYLHDCFESLKTIVKSNSNNVSKNGYLLIGKQNFKRTEDGQDTQLSNVIICFGKLTKVITKEYYDSTQGYPVDSLNSFAGIHQLDGNHTLLGISVV